MKQTCKKTSTQHRRHYERTAEIPGIYISLHFEIRWRDVFFKTPLKYETLEWYGIYIFKKVENKI